MDNFDVVNNRINENKNTQKQDLNTLRDELTSKQNEEIKKLETFV